MSNDTPPGIRDTDTAPVIPRGDGISATERPEDTAGRRGQFTELSFEAQLVGANDDNSISWTNDTNQRRYFGLTTVAWNPRVWDGAENEYPHRLHVRVRSVDSGGNKNGSMYGQIHQFPIQASPPIIVEDGGRIDIDLQNPHGIDTYIDLSIIVFHDLGELSFDTDPNHQDPT